MVNYTNITKVTDPIVKKAFIQTEENFLNNPRYTSDEYSPLLDTKLEDNNDKKSIDFNIVNLSENLIINSKNIDPYLSENFLDFDHNFTTTIIKNYNIKFDTLREDFDINLDLNLNREIINHTLELSTLYDIPLQVLVKYRIPFIIVAGKTESEAIEVLNQNSDFDKNFYMTLDLETITNIGSTANYLALGLKNYKATYTNSNTIELNKWIFKINTIKTFDIKGFVDVYSSFTIPKNQKYINIPVMRQFLDPMLDTSLEIINISTGKFNVLDLKSEPVIINDKIFDRLTLYSNNKNISGEDLKVKIENIKNLYIKKGQTFSKYSYYLENQLQGLTESATTSTGSGGSINTSNDQDSSLIILNGDLFQDEETLPTNPTPTNPDIILVEDSNIILDSNQLKIYANNYILNCERINNKIEYSLNIAEYNSIVKIYNNDDSHLIGEGVIDIDGNFSTYPLQSLSDGIYNVYFRVQDKDGNLSNPSPVITFTVDNTIPIAPSLSSFFTDEVSLITDTTELNAYKILGQTSNPNPIIFGTIKEKAIINIYINGIYFKSVESFKSTILKDARETTYSFIVRVDDGLLIENTINIITYTITDSSGNISKESKASNILYTPQAINSPNVYILSNDNKIGIINIITDNNDLTFYGNGTKAKTYTEIYLVNNNVETLLGKALVQSENSWKFNYKLVNGFTNYTFRFKVKKKSDGSIQTIDKNITYYNPNFSFNKLIEDIPNETRYKKVTLIFSSKVYGLNKDDFTGNGIVIINEEKFGITPFQTTDNKVFNFIIYLVENYNNTNLLSNLILNKYQINDSNLFENNSDLIIIDNYTNTKIITPVGSDYYTPFTPQISIRVTDNKYGTKTIKNNEIINDSMPNFTGINIGSWIEDSLYPLKLTRTFTLKKDTNFNIEAINGSIFDRHRAKILKIDTVSNNELKKSFVYLQKNNKYFDEVYYKSDSISILGDELNNYGSFVFPEYNKAGELYYKTIQIFYNQISKEFEKKETIIKQNNLLFNDYHLNDNHNISENGEYNLINNELQDPVTNYKLISNNNNFYTRKSLIKIERYLIIFQNSSTAKLNMIIDNPLGFAQNDPIFYNNEFILNLQPESSLLKKNAIFPNYETWEMDTVVSTLPSNTHIKLNKVLPTDNNIPGYYEFKLLDTNGSNYILPNTFKPIVIKLNMYYNLNIENNNYNSNDLIIPIKRYQMIDNSEILNFSWDKFNIIKTKILNYNDDKLLYEISRNEISDSYKINYYTLINNVPEDLEYDLELNNGYIEKIEIIDQNGIPFNKFYNIEIINPNGSFKIVKKQDSLNIKEILLTLKIYFTSTLNNKNIMVEMNNIYKYLNNNYGTEYGVYTNDIPYIKIIELKNLNNLNISTENYILQEYIKYNSIFGDRVFDPDSNYQSDIHEIDNIINFENYFTSISTSPTPIYKRLNNFLFNDIDFTELNSSRAILKESILKEISLKKELNIVRDLKYFGLEKSCQIIYSNGEFIVTPLEGKDIFLDNKNFRACYNEINDFDIYNTNALDNDNLLNTPPNYIWIHLDDISSNLPNAENNFDYEEYYGIGSGFNFKNPVGKYVKFKWASVCYGDFWINDNQLTTFKNSHNYSLPSTIQGTFRANNNSLINLDGGPTIVYGQYIVKNNNLTSLLGLPTHVGGLTDFYFDNESTPWKPFAPTDTTNPFWLTQQKTLNNDDLSDWNNYILEKSNLGSSIDLSFNSNLSITAFNNLSNGYGNIGWNLYLAGTLVDYSQANITTIRAKLKIAGLIFFKFNDTTFNYYINDTLSNYQQTDIDSNNFVIDTNHNLIKNRNLNILDNTNTNNTTKVNNTTLYDTFKLSTSSKIKNLLLNTSLKNYHKTNEIIN